jgi:SAM-dependent methyltransferase
MNDQTKTCIICGGTEFGSGPGGRSSITGAPPRCVKCQSLERHRATRTFFQKIFDETLFSTMQVLQFSKDFSVIPEWFKKYEVSVFGGHNTLDLQKIDRPSGAYDMVICNHVLEHVPDDCAAMRELVRITKDSGFVYLSVPAPLQKKVTQDWGFPNEERHGHYREYGANIFERFQQYIPEVFVFRVELVDSVTLSPDVGFLFFQRRNPLFQKVLTSGLPLSVL